MKEEQEVQSSVTAEHTQSSQQEEEPEPAAEQQHKPMKTDSRRCVFKTGGVDLNKETKSRSSNQDLLPSKDHRSQSDANV